MMDKKNIERLFQEKFKDFEMTPAPEAWENIASRLEKKENKKRIFPFWFNTKAASIAAALVLGFFGLYHYSNGFTWQNSLESTTTNTVVLQNKSKTNPSTQTSRSNIISTNNQEKITKSSTISTTSSIATIATTDIQQNTTAVESNTSSNISTKNPIASSVNSNVKRTISFSKKNRKPSFQKVIRESEILVVKEPKTTETSIIASVSEQKSVNATYSNSTKTKVSKEEPTVIADRKESSSVKSNFLTNGKNLEKFATIPSSNIENKLSYEKSTKSILEKNNTKKDNYSIADWKENNSSLLPNKSNTSQNSISLELYNKSTGKEGNGITKNSSVKEEIVVQENSKNATLEILNTSATAIVVVDSAKTNAVVENPLEKILKEKEQQKVAKNTEDKKEKSKSDWHIKPTVAPIFMFANSGSPIDAKFADNAKTYNSTFSVGIGVEKRLSDRFYFRTSVNNLELSYNTNDIAYHSTLNLASAGGRGLGNVSVSQSAMFTTIEDSNDPTFNNSEVLQDKKEGYLNQRISYVEIPFEVSYKILNKKVGIQLMTGLSTLFLNKNQVSLISDNLSSELGQANNLNVVHFSTNIGLGFKYKIFNALEASVEPTLKYQLFTFHTNAGGFKPYIIGLYSGVSYRF